ncbi:MAG TPA: heterodisulfide reductase-related iron-sulfur binding cluster [candidate division Zixibacteria bacterium]|nr:heterodisulfide reductase-related iron-sulfur binding cluster [candidate division Zixibacteria bacterium]
MIPTREVYWNVGRAWPMYVLLIAALLICAWGIRRRFRLWRRGRPEARFDAAGERLQGLLLYGFGHAALLRRRYAGVFHALLFFGFFVLFIGTVVVMVHEDLGWRIMQGRFYLYFQSLTLDLFGALAIAGCLMAVCRRYVARPASLGSTWQDAVILSGIVLILLTGFAVEGLRIVVTGDPWGDWSPVGLATGRLLAALLPAGALRPLHGFLWWFHLVAVLAFIAWLPYSKLFHVFAAAANIYLRSLEPKGARLKTIDMEAPSYGVSRLDQFTWKDLLDLDACTECGRCQDACPAYATGKPLSPKAIVLDLRRHLHAPDSRPPEEGNPTPLVGGAVREETLWSCTTCMACMEQCPVFVEHVPKIIDMRRYLVMEEGRLPGPMEQALRSLESRGHPYAGLSASRLEWCEGLDLRVLSEGDRAETLYWVGCSAAMNVRQQKTARALARLLRRAGVDFAVLGERESCSGDPARRIGNEYLFRTLAQRNIEILKSHGVKRIVTACPHCFNALKNDYPRLGGSFEVRHHSEMLAELLREGRLRAPQKSDAKVTYHDPCYLGRYNDIYDEPRAVIETMSASGIAEMEQRRERSFCCGAGGGLMWADETGARINNERAGQALQTGAGIVGVACPFCMTMLEDGIKAAGNARDVKVADIAELLEAANQA